LTTAFFSRAQEAVNLTASSVNTYLSMASMDNDPLFKVLGNSDSDKEFSEFCHVGSMDNDPLFPLVPSE
jgi:hypothetical protein